ncbi:MAG: hypothetical protein ABI896_06835 [Actinomycetota bacterium]
MKKLIMLAAGLATAVVFAGAGTASSQGHGHGHGNGHGHHGKVKHFGPYASDTTDSGTCGVDWAADHVNRFFKIRRTGAETFDVRERYAHGTFTSFAAPSPGACDSSDNTGPGLVATGVTGRFHGYDRIAVTSAIYTPETAACPAPCASTDDFLASVFGPTYTRNDYAFSFKYSSHAEGLVYHHWRNASCNRGGNRGDIQSASGAAVETPVCP